MLGKSIKYWDGGWKRSAISHVVDDNFVRTASGDLVSIRDIRPGVAWAEWIDL